MRVCCVSRESPRAFGKNGTGEQADLFVFGFQGLEAVSYERELKGETGYFEELARLSKERNAAVVCGFITDTRGLKRKSVLVAENGRILGVSDMLNVIDGEWNAGACARVFETKKGRMGVVVAEDLYFFEVVKALCVAGCDFIVCPFGQGAGAIELVMLRANAFSFGVPILFCAKGYAVSVGISGEVEFSSPKSPVCFPFETLKNYHLIETRQRGFFKPQKGEY